MSATTRTPGSDARDEPRLEHHDSFEPLRAEWSALALRSGNVFATPEFLELWWEHHGGRGALRLVAVRTAGAGLVAVLPLYMRRRGPLRTLRFLGHGAGDELGPICAPDDWTTAAHALRDVLDGGGWDVFLGEHLPGDRRWVLPAGMRRVRDEGSPVLDVGGMSWDELLAARSRNLREQVRRRERKLEREQGSRFRLSAPATIEADLDRLFALHRDRWRDTSAFAREETFHRAFAACALERGWLRLWLLEVGEAPVAAWYGFRFAGAESYFQSGRDSSWDGYAVGFVLLAHTIRAAVEDGQREYRFLRGDEPYKYRFANRDPGLVTVARGRGAAGAAAVALAASVGGASALAPLRRRLLR